MEDPLYGLRPPKTKERWSDTEHGMIEEAEYDVLPANLIRKTVAG